MKEKKCDSSDIALKSLFLGPQAENISQVAEVLIHSLERWAHYRRSRFPEDGLTISSADQSESEFQQTKKLSLKQLDYLIKELEEEIPKFSPRYFGHMFSETSLPALYGSFLSLVHNPNNISSEASRVCLKIEQRAIQKLYKMFGFKSEAYGHFTSCGSIANLEAALRARCKIDKSHIPAYFLPQHAHYSWAKAMLIMNVPSNQVYWVNLDQFGRMCTKDLKSSILRAQNSGHKPCLVVSLFGSTEFGICDPIDKVESLLNELFSKADKPWHHVDAAYGGFFSCLKSTKRIFTNSVSRSLRSIQNADSVTIDPHKLGYVPYAVGAFICKSKKLYQMNPLHSPYLNKQQSQTLWTIEGSRSSQGALSIELFSKILPFNKKGFGRVLTRHFKARDSLIETLKTIPNLRILHSHDLNIIAFVIAKHKESTLEVSQRNLRLYIQFSPKNKRAQYIISKTEVDSERYSALLKKYVSIWGGKINSPLTVLRVCLMNPFQTSKEANINFIKDFCDQLIKLSKL